MEQIQIKKEQAEKIIKELKPSVVCWSKTSDHKWDKQPDFSFSKEFKIVAVCKFVEYPPYHSWHDSVEFKDGVLTITRYIDNRVRGNYGCIGGEVEKEVKTYQVI
ncbi:MAG: hypothetical protein IRZ03_19330 [Acidobacterium ailaaui]|nr:hypothetical protein [Pseudacidobacterium ailaaui]